MEPQEKQIANTELVSEPVMTPEAAPASVKKHSCTPVIIILAILAIGGLGFGGYEFWQNIEKDNHIALLEKEKSELEQENKEQEDIVFRIVNQNWGLIDYSRDWLETEWTIYDDFSIEKKETIGEETTKEKLKISKEDYEKLQKLFEKAKNNKKHSDALDGDAWGFAYYNNGIEEWSRQVDYTYGIKDFENIEKIIEKY